MAKQKARRGRSPATPQAAPSRKVSRALVITAAAVIAAILLAALLLMMQPSALRTAFQHPDLNAPARFVGSETCATCHAGETDLWRQSQHAKAMAHASEKSVLGDFNDARFEYFGVRSRMFRRDGKFMVETDGPDGKLATFEVKYTFGLEPLQQYLVEFPDGRVQALALSWDTRPREAGGQRWFHLYPHENVDHTDVLHWTSRTRTGTSCAPSVTRPACARTTTRRRTNSRRHLPKSRSAAKPAMDRVRDTPHGRARTRAGCRSASRDDATFGLLVRYAERLNVTWPIDAKTGSARRSAPPATLRTEVESCGMCHARRGQLAEDWVPGRWLSHTHAVSNLSRGLYDFAGQMDDEVFNYGSFKQSRMFAAGVTCSDCHDPHSAKIRYPRDGVCLNAMRPRSSPPPRTIVTTRRPTPVTCANCHMPVRTYMVVDDRHDHSFRVPRPDESVRSGAPNACNDCHKDKGAQWAASAIENWHGPQRKGFQTYAPAFAAAHVEQPGRRAPAGRGRERSRGAGNNARDGAF